VVTESGSRGGRPGSVAAAAAAAAEKGLVDNQAPVVAARQGRRRRCGELVLVCVVVSGADEGRRRIFEGRSSGAVVAVNAVLVVGCQVIARLKMVLVTAPRTETFRHSLIMTIETSANTCE